MQVRELLTMIATGGHCTCRGWAYVRCSGQRESCRSSRGRDGCWLQQRLVCCILRRGTCALRGSTSRMLQIHSSCECHRAKHGACRRTLGDCIRACCTAAGVAMRRSVSHRLCYSSRVSGRNFCRLTRAWCSLARGRFCAGGICVPNCCWNYHWSVSGETLGHCACLPSATLCVVAVGGGLAQRACTLVLRQ